MKKALTLLSVCALLLCCDKEDNGPAQPGIVGKWTVYEHVVDGKTEPAELAEELSYVEFRSDNTCENFSYGDYETTTGTYTLNGNRISVQREGHPLTLKIVDRSRNMMVLENGNEQVRVRRSENEPLFFLEPVLEFGAAKSRIKSLEPRELSSDYASQLHYSPSNVNELGIDYLFDTGGMKAAALYIDSECDGEQFKHFLASRYRYTGEKDGALFYTGLGFGVTVSAVDGRLSILYSPVADNAEAAVPNTTLLKAVHRPATAGSTATK